MSRVKCCVPLVAGALALVLSVPTAAAAEANVVPDLAFRECLNSRYLNADDAAPITATQLKALTDSVFCADDDIVFVAGAEYLTGIVELSLVGTSVTDLSALKGLKNLQQLFLYDTPVSDVSALKGLTALEDLYLTLTQVSNVTALKGLTSLDTLDLSDTPLSNVSALAGLTGLEELDLGGTRVSDLSALKGLTGLQELDLLGAPVSDVSPLKGLTGLQELDLAGTQVSDVSALKGLTGLQGLDISYTRVSDVSPLAGLKGISDLDVSHARVADVSSLANLPAMVDTCGAADDGESCSTYYGAGQTATLPQAVKGTYRLPIAGVTGDPVTVKVTSGPARVNNAAGTITYTGTGTVKLSWQSKSATTDSDVGFSGVASVVVGAKPAAVSSQPASGGQSAGGQPASGSKPAASFGKVGTPKIAGKAAVGRTLSVSSAGTWSPAPTGYGFQWFRSGVAISGATKSAYTLVAADRGKKVTVRLVGRRSGYKDTVSPPAAAVTVGFGALSSSTPVISGTPRVGKTLTAVVGKWTPGVKFAYQWFANGTRVGKATKPTLKISSALRGKTITVAVTGARAGYTSRAVVAKPVLIS